MNWLQPWFKQVQSQTLTLSAVRDFTLVFHTYIVRDVSPVCFELLSVSDVCASISQGRMRKTAYLLYFQTGFTY